MVRFSAHIALAGLACLQAPGCGTTDERAASEPVSGDRVVELRHSATVEDLREVEVFRSGTGGYHTYRIPSIVRTNAGTLLAFCEGRKEGRGDAGDIDLLMRRSEDGGQTWNQMEVLWDDGTNTCGNPSAVVDRTTGTIWLLLTWNRGDVHESRIQAGHGDDSRLVYVTHSLDDGRIWAQPREITASVKDVRWSWYATGPGAGIQIERGEHAGRLVIPCDHKLPTEGGVEYRSHVLYSDDHGRTWQLGGSAPEADVNECEVAELSDGRLLLNMRNYDKSLRARQTCVSADGGSTWSDQAHAPALIEPICQASFRRQRWPEGHTPGVLLFSNPASTESRVRMTVRASQDDGASWPYARVVHDGSSAYSCLVALDREYFGCLYEKDEYGVIAFAVASLAWLDPALDASRGPSTPDPDR